MALMIMNRSPQNMEPPVAVCSLFITNITAPETPVISPVIFKGVNFSVPIQEATMVIKIGVTNISKEA